MAHCGQLLILGSHAGSTSSSPMYISNTPQMKPIPWPGKQWKMRRKKHHTTLKNAEESYSQWGATDCKLEAKGQGTKAGRVKGEGRCGWKSGVWGQRETPSGEEVWWFWRRRFLATMSPGRIEPRQNLWKSLGGVVNWVNCEVSCDWRFQPLPILCHSKRDFSSCHSSMVFWCSVSLLGSLQYPTSALKIE